ncbi:hypothetical protein OBRU01_24334 [Operophtera brumata]|uniref:Uncharacterized protein n=1 Tax=Operophtera brumata TaxID=104452 RepID=A0A0L7KMP9_OPEBR|nr:hypothetical protein OBRU01_24334 [Operophtera brumata]
MSAQGLTSEAQLRYLLQWFGEFSELQKEDFMPVLAAARVSETDPEFGKKLHELIENGPQAVENGPHLNGEENGTGEAHSPIIEEPSNGEVRNDEPHDVEEAADPVIIPEAAPVEIAAAS